MKCFYHHADLDGITSGAVVHRKYPECELISFGYGMTFPFDDIAHNETVILVDLSLHPKEMRRLIETSNLIWIDHHVKAIDDSIENNYDYIPGIRIDGIGACELTWRHFFKDEPVPLILRFVGTYDTWGHTKLDYHEKMKYIYVEYGLRSYIHEPPDSDIWQSFFHSNDTPSKLYGSGRDIFTYMRNFWKHSLRKYKIQWEGYTCIVANLQHNEMTALYDALKDEDYEIFISYAYNGYDWSVSLRTEKPNIKTHKIAEKYGGGGHAGASGFKTKNINMLLGKQ